MQTAGCWSQFTRYALKSDQINYVSRSMSTFEPVYIYVTDLPAALAVRGIHVSLRKAQLLAGKRRLPFFPLLSTVA
jgi:hypothetical protein